MPYEGMCWIVFYHVEEEYPDKIWEYFVPGTPIQTRNVVIGTCPTQDMAISIVGVLRDHHGFHGNGRIQFYYFFDDGFQNRSMVVAPDKVAYRWDSLPTFEDIAQIEEVFLPVIQNEK